MIKDRQSWQELREGAYLLRTKLIGDRAEELWPKYIQLTEAEAVFRALKSELAIRPIFHQLERRVKTLPTPEHKKILDHLGIQLPDRLDFNHKCSGDLEIA